MLQVVFIVDVDVVVVVVVAAATDAVAAAAAAAAAADIVADVGEVRRFRLFVGFDL